MSEHAVDPHPEDRCWLSFPANDKRAKVRPRSYGGGGDQATGHYHLDNLTAREVEAMHSFLSGASYVRVIHGRLHAWHAWEELPEPEQDPLLTPHWPADGEPAVFGGDPKDASWYSPAIHISGLGAGRPGSYESSARTLRLAGFYCLRSPRDESGRIWEQWYLPGVWAAKGSLEEYMDAPERRDLDWFKQAEVACRFIVEELGVRFGSMDISIQRWCLANPD